MLEDLESDKSLLKKIQIKKDHDNDKNHEKKCVKCNSFVQADVKHECVLETAFDCDICDFKHKGRSIVGVDRAKSGRGIGRVYLFLH